MFLALQCPLCLALGWVASDNTQVLVLTLRLGITPDSPQCTICGVRDQTHVNYMQDKSSTYCMIPAMPSHPGLT